MHVSLTWNHEFSLHQVFPWSHPPSRPAGTEDHRRPAELWASWIPKGGDRHPKRGWSWMIWSLVGRSHAICNIASSKDTLAHEYGILRPYGFSISLPLQINSTFGVSCLIQSFEFLQLCFGRNYWGPIMLLAKRRCIIWRQTQIALVFWQVMSRWKTSKGLHSKITFMQCYQNRAMTNSSFVDDFPLFSLLKAHKSRWFHS